MKSLPEFKEMVRDRMEQQQKMCVDISLRMRCNECETGFTPRQQVTQSCPACDGEDVVVVTDDVDLICMPCVSRWLN